MRRDADFFSEREVELVYIAKKLSEAQALEALLTSAGVDYAVEADEYMGGLIFRHVRVGAFFYVLREAAEQTRETMRTGGYRPQHPPEHTTAHSD